jgi:hypothetical protein
MGGDPHFSGNGFSWLDGRVLLSFRTLLTTQYFQLKGPLPKDAEAQGTLSSSDTQSAVSLFTSGVIGGDS